MGRMRWMILALLVQCAACAPAPRTRPVRMGPVDEGPATLAAARKYLEGQWTLESFEVFPPGQPQVALKGTGLVTYDAFGNLRMEIRSDPASADLLRKMGLELRDGVIATDGRTAVDMQNRTLTYVLDGGQTPGGTGPLAMNRPRHWEVNETVLTLTTRGDDGKPLSVSRWRKAQ
jgi:hypothetical protein